MALLQLKDASLSFGLRPVLDRVDLVIEPGERIGLLGRNGEGKSTLLKVFTGEQVLDSGQIHRLPGLRIGRLEQEIITTPHQTVFELVKAGLEHQDILLQRYHTLTTRIAQGQIHLHSELEQVQKAIESENAWNTELKADAILSRLGLDPQAEYALLSGGMKRRVLLARALVNDPELLLLDEPTNHLDIDAISWMEDFLYRFKATLIFITHDRRFLRKMAQRILELDRGRLFDWACGYDAFLERKQALLDNEEAHQAKFDKRLAEEEVWIRQGIKARRTRNEGRVRALKQMRMERRQRLERIGNVNFRLQESKGSGTLVAEARHVDFSYEQTAIIRDFSTIIEKGDRVGVIGPNGAGKTTLIRLLLGELRPSAGHVRTGTNLEMAYFDQHRALLDETQTVMYNLSEGRETITINGRDLHVLRYLQDFLFSPERARSPVSVLSGGERNRLLLAKLFSKPTNLLVLDEPTNDLDLETLELLEEVINEYTGTLIIISHDRDFINNTVTQCLVLQGDGTVHEFIGDYDDWLAFKASQQPSEATKVNSKDAGNATVIERPKKLSLKEQKELSQLPGMIEQLESEHSERMLQLSAPDFYKQEHTLIKEFRDATEQLEQQIAQLYDRWQTLEELKNQTS